MFRLTQKVKPLVLCILDGWGIAADYPGNAITKANPANFNSLWFSYPHTYLTTMGQLVGMPKGTVGNSEVGHLNLGAGKIVMQDALRINIAISNGSFFENEAFFKAIEHVMKNKSDIHLMGLVGPGNVHSDTTHLMALLSLLKQAEIPSDKVKIHAFTDGRDSPPTSAKSYVGQLEENLKKEDLGEIATICGRYFAMDRDNRWDRTEKAYLALIGNWQIKASLPHAVIENSYSDGITDEFIEPTTIVGSDNNPLGPIKENDAVIFFNFRPDRARQLTRAFTVEDFRQVKTASGETVKTFDREKKLKNLFFVTLTQYDSTLPTIVAFKPENIPMPIARVFAERNLHQLHIAETEKYAHVTYFFNGGRETPFTGEDRILVNSPKVASYDLVPQMSAAQIAKKVVERINGLFYDFIVINFANADMVAHTGKIDKAVEAIKCVDQYLGIIIKTALAVGGGVIVTADHGNAEEMINHQTNQADTEHNGNPAPFIAAIPELRGKATQLNGGILADVAPTILSIMGIGKPPQMTGRNLLE